MAAWLASRRRSRSDGVCCFGSRANRERNVEVNEVGKSGCGLLASGSRAWILGAGLAAVTACGGPPAWTVTIEPVTAPTDVVSFSPQVTVQAGRVILSWLQLGELQYSLAFAERTASGWSAPRQVTSGDTLVSNAADVPSVHALADGTLVAHWLQREGAHPDAYDSPLSWSRDGGRTWSNPVTPHHDGTKTQHGFTSIFEPAGGGLGVVWLDGRNTDPHLPEGQNGDMALWFARFGSDGTQTSEAAVETRVCDCCQTSAAVAGDAALVAYRGRTADEIRDIHVTRYTGGSWSVPTTVHADGWKIQGCPVNGPAISARGDAVAVAWFTAAGGQAQIYAAFSADGGRTFGDRIAVDEGTPTGHVDVELFTDLTAAVSWTALDEGRSRLFVRRLERGGGRSHAVAVADVAGTHYPRMALGNGELVFVWTEIVEGFSHIRTARAALP
jgi:hypothetical protein